VYLIWNGVPIWVELKVVKTNKVSLSPTQIAWHTSHSDSGGVSFILVKHLGQGTVFLFEGRGARSVSREGLLFEPIFSGLSLDDALHIMRETAVEQILDALR